MEPLYYVLEPCGALGWALMIGRDEGVRAVSFGDDPETLQQQAESASQHAVLAPTGSPLQAWSMQLASVVSDPHRACNMPPLSPVGTEFQHTVWAALRTIPPGATRTYAELAGALLDRPRAARAVAGACAANPIAVLIPCHRIVRSDGGFGGYRWGLARKRILLERERVGNVEAPAPPRTPGAMSISWGPLAEETNHTASPRPGEPGP